MATFMCRTWARVVYCNSARPAAPWPLRAYLSLPFQIPARSHGAFTSVLMGTSMWTLACPSQIPMALTIAFSSITGAPAPRSPFRFPILMQDKPTLHSVRIRKFTWRAPPRLPGISLPLAAWWAHSDPPDSRRPDRRDQRRTPCSGRECDPRAGAERPPGPDPRRQHRAASQHCLPGGRRTEFLEHALNHRSESDYGDSDY